MLFGKKQPDLSQPALKRFAISKQAFHSPTECEDLFRNTALEMLSNSIIQQLSNADKIHLIFGEDGIGKSSFCRRLFCDATPELKIKFFTAKKQSNINKILLAITGSDSENPDPRELATKAAKHIFRDLRNQQQPVLLIDDAHLLSPAVLRMIFRFIDSIKNQNLGLLKLVLVAERQLDNKLQQLNNAAPAEEQLHTSLLRSLNRIEIADYIEFRLVSAGAQNVPLDVKILTQIYELSGGLPGKIDYYVCEAFNHGRILTSNKSRHLKKLVFFSIVILAAVSAGVYWFSQQTNQNKPPIETFTPNPTKLTPKTTKNNSPPAGIKIKSVALTASTTPSTITAEDSTTVQNQKYLLRDAEWLQQWPSENHVIQLLGLWEREKMLAAAKTDPLEKDLILTSGKKDSQT